MVDLLIFLPAYFDAMRATNLADGKTRYGVPIAAVENGMAEHGVIGSTCHVLRKQLARGVVDRCPAKGSCLNAGTQVLRTLDRYDATVAGDGT